MPNLQQRAELLRIAEAMHTGTPAPSSGAAGGGLPLPSNIRSSSQERELPSESACSLCGADTQSPDFRPSDHGENLCGRGTISCPLCAKTFSLWSHYEAHKKCHQKLKQRQYPCQTCGKVSIHFHKIHIFKVSFFTEFTFFKHQILGNFWIGFCPSVIRKGTK